MANRLIYNVRHLAFTLGRHPDLLGSARRNGRPEVADFNDNVVKVGLSGGTLHYQELELTCPGTAGLSRSEWISPVRGCLTRAESVDASLAFWP